MSQEFSRRLRNHTTIHERCFWDALRGRKLERCRCRRQVPIGNYIADFVCLERRLIIELDGAFHGQQREYDEARTAWLGSQGFLVLRYWNSDVFDDLEGVLEGIANNCVRGKDLEMSQPIEGP